MDKVFEYAAMRAMAENIARVVMENDGQLCYIADALMTYAGLITEEISGGRGYVVYPNHSRRVKPACVVVCEADCNMEGWRSLIRYGRMICYVYEAGEYRVAGSGKVPRVRPEAKGSSLCT